MSIAIDIGNTRTKLAAFRAGVLVEKTTVDVLTVTAVQAFATNHSAKKLIYSTVAGINEGVQDYLEAAYDCMELTAETPLPFSNTYGTPKTLGKDRLAAIAGALQLYPRTNCLVIDAGTCITYDILTQAAVYEGGNIAPGLQLRLRAMHEFTSALPLVKQVPITQPIGKSTETALQNGGLWGAVLEMEGVIAWCATRFDRLNVILTGGDADFFANHLKSKIFVHPNLVLVGLNKILAYNDS